MNDLKKGFTFIEFLIYIAVLAVVIGSVNAVIVGMLYNRAKIVAIEEVNQNARFAVERVGYLIRNAEDISAVEGDSLTIILDGESILIKEEDNLIVVSKDGHGESITSSRVTINELEFTDLSFPGGDFHTIRVKIDMEYNNPQNLSQYKYERTFYDTFNAKK